MKRIPMKDLKFSFSRSSGAGGQNVNKVNTKVTLYWEIESSEVYSRAMLERFKNKYKRYIQDGVVVIKSQKYRSQPRNIDDCVNKLHELLETVQKVPKKRVPTKPTKAAKKKRLESKRIRGEKKRLRSKPIDSD